MNTPSEITDIINRLSAAFQEIASIEVKGAFAPNVTRAMTHIQAAEVLARNLIPQFQTLVKEEEIK